MSATCPHGFPPSECLICKTLGSQPQVQVETGRVTAGGAGVPLGAGVRVRSSRGTRQPEPPDAVYPPGPVGRRSHSLATYAVLVIVGLVAIVAVAGVLAGAVFALLRLLELLVVAAVAGWVGYRWGHYRGRRRGQ